jgi:hypothetical protein
MCTAAAPASASDALWMLHAGLALQRAAAGFLAVQGAADLPAAAMGEPEPLRKIAGPAARLMPSSFMAWLDALAQTGTI